MESDTKTPTPCVCVVGAATNLTRAPYNKPAMELLRARDVMDRLGITYSQLRKLVSCGIIKPIKKRGCRPWFRARDLETI